MKEYKGVFFTPSGVEFSPREDGLYVCGMDASGEYIFYLVGIDAANDSVTLTRGDNGETIYGSIILSSFVSD